MFIEYPHAISIEETMNLLKSSLNGLAEEEVYVRRKQYGKNVLEEEKISKFKIIVRNFLNILTYVLLAASLMSALAGKWLDFLAVVILIILNTLISFWQEFKAEKAILSLKKMTESKVKVVREGKHILCSSSELVPGDLVTLSEGDIITADLRLFESFSLSIDEAALTGESMPVHKDHSVILPQETLPFELKNIAFTGTTVVKGTGKGFVIRTGKNTYFAKIADKIKEPSPESSLTKAVKYFLKRYITLIVTLFIIVGIIAFFQKRPLVDVAYILVAQLVSALPVGLPMVIVVTLVFGGIALSRKNVLVRHLPAVETLGSTTVIASDKTGTITAGKLIVKDFLAIDSHLLRLCAALCNDVHDSIGDPIDLALARWIEEYETLQKENKRLWTFPFDSALKMMGTVNKVEQKELLFVKGAYEELEKIAENTADFKHCKDKLQFMSEEGLRVIALGCGEWKGESLENWRVKIVGLVGFLDPPKEGVKEAVIEAQKAGLKLLMLTGDHPATAKKIASEVGIWREGDLVVDGTVLEKHSDKELWQILLQTTVLARILPEHKYRIVKILQENGEIVAVSGDGVNDVPALKMADLGIAMGSGTEAAKNVSKMILVDNNLRVLVEAIRKGRIIADNIRKIIYYLLSTSIQEIYLIVMAIFAGYPLPLLPIQILWVNLITDGVSDKVFPFTKEEGDVMKRSPIPTQKQFFDKEQILNIFSFGLIMGALAFEFFKHLLNTFEHDVAITITFTCVAVAQWANAIQSQKEKEPFFKNIKRSFTINPYVYITVFIGLMLQIFAVHVKPEWFHCVPLSWQHWKYPLLFFILAFFLVELRKCLALLFRYVCRFTKK